MATEVTFLGSTSRTADATSTALSGPEDEGYKGVWVCLDITVASTSPTLDVKLQRLDKVSENWIDIPGAAFAQKTTTGTSDLTIYPGIGETANVSVSDHVTDTIRAIGDIGGASTPTMTYSLAGRWLK